VPTLSKLIGELGLSLVDPPDAVVSGSTRSSAPAEGQFVPLRPGDDVEAALLTELPRVVQTGVRTNLATRLADEIENFVLSQNLLSDVDLPSSRKIAQALGIHRNTVRSALDLLVERSVVRHAGSGRFTVQVTEQLLRRAASAYAQQGCSEDEFADLARSVYYRENGHGGEVVFVGDFESIPELSPRSLNRALGMQVAVESLENVASLSAAVLITSTRNITDVRRLAPAGSEVLSVGSTLDVDIRVALSVVPTDAHVVALVNSPGTREALEWRIRAWRPDIRLKFSADSEALPEHIDLALVPEGSGELASAVPLRTYRTGISAGELELLRARVLAALPPRKPDPLSPAAGWSSRDTDPTRKIPALRDLPLARANNQRPT
jgi:DNA-binding transcriptional regulator YhcF (GntR family)